MWEKVLATNPDWSMLLLRLILAFVIFPHGAQKVLGWFGGYGFSGTMKFFTQTQRIPSILALLAIAAEFLGSIGLAIGLLTRVAAFGILCVMVVAVLTVHLAHGFFINWTGQKKGEGFEFHILVAAIAAVLIVNGAGLWSIDGLLAGSLR